MLLEKIANEESTFFIDASIYDENENAITPTSLTWSLFDTEGNVINSREDVSIANLSSVVEIVLSGDDLALSNSETSAMIKRYLVVQGTYDDSNSDSRSLTEEFIFFIKNLTGI
tara:strand:+ start:519 stop:860 length:342 start_codon:yes stop_codon:yes gene_type:complete